MKKNYSREEITAILKKIPNRSGWDFSFMKKKRQTVPWKYENVVSLYLNESFNILDVGTGGGEKLKQFAELVKTATGVDVDPRMIEVTNSSSATNTKFLCDDEKLSKVDDTFDVILNRHAPYNLSAIQKKLKPGGLFITQQVGEKNMENILDSLGIKHDSKPTISINDFDNTGLKLISFMEYDVRYEVLDEESLFFWLNALDILGSGKDINKTLTKIDKVNKLMSEGVKDGVFVTNEHRYLAIAEKN